ncbi:hypothetical protein [Methanosphaerula palustris]|uniref:hypothetical protein n=1 Tax=Methanosphaerula palustris TaxID=475088 RepID=UPI001575F667|nr:hypothetical protein [Methanosphaerula palustris]
MVVQVGRVQSRYGCRGLVDSSSGGLLLRFDGVPGHPAIGPDDIPDDVHLFYADLI